MYDVCKAWKGISYILLYIELNIRFFLSIVEGWSSGAARPFMATMPSLPAKLLSEVNSGLSLSMLPIFEDGAQSEFLRFPKRWFHV